MKGIETALKVKKRELSKEEKKLKELLIKLEELKTQEVETQERIESLKKLKVNTPLELAFLKATASTLLSKLEQIEKDIRAFSEKVEKQREKIAIKRGEIKAIEKFIEKRKAEKKRKEEFLLERFVHEVLSSRFND